MLMFGLKVTALGFGIVFVALYGLSLLIDLQSKILGSKPKKNLVEPKQEAPAPAAPVTVAKTDDEDEIAAVIAAAVAACGHQAVVKTITRLTGNTGAAWSATGRTEAMNARQI